MRGDHIKVWRGAFWHHGIDVGNNQVIHLSEGEPVSRFTRFLTKKKSSKVEKTSMEDFLKGGEAVMGGLRNTAPALEKEEVAKRAESIVGNPSKYNILFRNCEHMSNWCETGDPQSYQVRGALKKAVLGVAGVAGIVGASMLKKRMWEETDIVERINNILQRTNEIS
jgi:hypothetical protein